MKKKLISTSESNTLLLQRVKRFLSEPPSEERGTLIPVVEKFLERKDAFLHLANQYPTPFYVLDMAELQHSIEAFASAFTRALPRYQVYFAMKTNHHPIVLQSIIAKGWGLDVSSVREFDLAKEQGCRDLIFTGPGKTIADLSYAIEHHPSITIMMDSFGELSRLGEVTKRINRKVKAGIRIYPSTYTTWSKFGIPLQELQEFWQRARQFPLIDLQGIQFHLSWNDTVLPYQKTFEELAQYLKNHFTQTERSQIKFIDFGGGFWPYQSEGVYPWGIPQGNVIKTINDYYDKPTAFRDNYFISTSIPIEQFAQGIGEAIETYLSPLVSCAFYTEPGRILSNNSMHILLRAIDIKNEHNVIMDGGVNIVGWERFEYEYFPIINFSHPALTEQACMVYGPLCMPKDLWGNYYYGSTMNEGDVCLVPSQGCLTYSLAQNFIRPIPPVYTLT